MNRIDFDSRDNIKACLFEAKAHPARARKKVNPNRSHNLFLIEFTHEG